MSESAYDIAYLLEAELAKVGSPTPVASRMDAISPAATATVKHDDIAATQAAMARELLALDGAHEQLIRQYMQINSFKTQA